MIIIKTLHFEDYEDFACAVSDAYDRVKSDDEYNSVDVVAKYEDAKEIIRELICIGYDITFINEFADVDWDRYDDAFVISLYENGIWCEPVKCKEGYISVEADVVYLFDNCSSKIIPKIEADEVYEVAFDDDCDDKYDNCDCRDLDTEKKQNKLKIDNDMHGFSISNTNNHSNYLYSFYSTDKNLVNNEIKLIKELLNVRM